MRTLSGEDYPICIIYIYLFECIFISLYLYMCLYISVYTMAELLCCLLQVPVMHVYRYRYRYIDTYT